MGAAVAAHAPPVRPAAYCLYSAGRSGAPPSWHTRRSLATSHSHQEGVNQQGVNQQGVSWTPPDSHGREQAADLPGYLPGYLPGERPARTLPSKGLLSKGLLLKIQSLPTGLLQPPQAHRGSGGWRLEAGGWRLQAHRGYHQVTSSAALSACSAAGVGALGTSLRPPPQHGAAASPPPAPRCGAAAAGPASAPPAGLPTSRPPCSSAHPPPSRHACEHRRGVAVGVAQPPCAAAAS